MWGLGPVQMSNFSRAEPNAQIIIIKNIKFGKWEVWRLKWAYVVDGGEGSAKERKRESLQFRSLEVNWHLCFISIHMRTLYTCMYIYTCTLNCLPDSYNNNFIILMYFQVHNDSMHLSQIVLLIIIIIIIDNSYYHHWKLWFNSYILIYTNHTLKLHPGISHNKDAHINLFVPQVVIEIHMMNKAILH